jgi:hypothetical protein
VEDIQMGLFDFVGDVVGAALPIVGGIVGGPVGSLVGSAVSGPASDLFSHGIPDFLGNLIDSISPQHQCCPPSRPSPWTPPCDPGGPGGSAGNTTIEKLFALIAKFQKNLDDTVNDISGKDKPSAADTAKLQQAFADFNAGVAACSAGLKAFGDANAGIAQRIA